MSKMIVYICVIWITGVEQKDLTKCIWHTSQVKYETLDQCKADLKMSMELLRIRIRQEFGNKPKQIFIQPNCVLRS